MSRINLSDNEVGIMSLQDEGYICITDMAKFMNAEYPYNLIRNWFCNRNSIEFLGIGEHLNNPDFNPVEFDSFKHEAGSNAFILSPQKRISNRGTSNIEGTILYHSEFGVRYSRSKHRYAGFRIRTSLSWIHF